jgi:asparagine synthase (glutamine-hydrolysing)
MCGIALLVGSDAAAAADTFDRMVEGIRSRGEVLETDRSATALLATSRLRIVDRERAVQPWTSPDGRWALCYNGEVFNHDELRSRLQQEGHAQRSESDTEVVLEALLAWGDDAMLQFRGEFAFALVDRTTGAVLMARDPAGVKPLYWARAHGRLHVASEVKSLTSLGAAIHEVPPGCIGRGSASADPVLHPYIDLLRLGEGEPVLARVADAKAALRRTLEDSVRLRVDTDLPVAVILSGGLDSSLTLLLARQMHPNVHAFTVGTKGSEDVAYASRLACDLRVPHEVISLRPRDISLRDVKEAIFRSEATEYGDVINAVVSLKVFERVHQRGIKVVLTGDGSDELFGGYDMYAQVPEADRRSLFLHKIRHLSRTELQRVDRTSMGLGVEARVPFLDLQMLLLSMRIPLEMKVRDGYEKWIVRETFADLLPDYIKARHKNPMSHSSGLHERIRLFKPLFPRIYRSFGYGALGPMRRDFSVVLARHDNDLRRAVTAAELAEDYRWNERLRDFTGAVRWNLLGAVAEARGR